MEEEYAFLQLVNEIITDPNQMILLDESSRCDRTTNPTKPRRPGYATLSYTKTMYTNTTCTNTGYTNTIYTNTIL